MSNVLIYSGPGVSTSCSHHTLITLRRLLPTYDVQLINSTSIALHPWQHYTSLFVLPGGRDLPYVDELEKQIIIPINSNSNTSSDPSSNSSPSTTTAATQIRNFVTQGGKFIGICAGAYYSSGRCEFEKGVENLQVVGERNALRFFQGICKGTVYPGFSYDSEIGGRIVKLTKTDRKRKGVKENEEKDEDENQIWWTHYNGGGSFLNVENLENIEVLAHYSNDDEELKQNLEGFDYSGKAAIISCKVGDQNGKAILFGTHPEFPLKFNSKPIQFLKNGKQNLPFSFSKEDEKKETLDEEGKLNLNQEKELELESLEIKRLRNFGEILRDELSLVVSLPEFKEVKQKKEAAASSSRTEKTTFSDQNKDSSPQQNEDQIKLTPLYLVSQNTNKVEDILRNLYQTSIGKNKGKEEILHLKELSSSTTSSSKIKSQDLNQINSSHLFSFKDVNDTFHFYSTNPNDSKETTTDSILSDLCKTSDYSNFKTSTILTSNIDSKEKEEEEISKEVDLQRIPKYIITYPSSDDDDFKFNSPNPKLTPHFNLKDYFSFLNQSRNLLKGIDFDFKVRNDWFGGFEKLDFIKNEDEDEFRIGDPLIYSQIVTSTQTMLDKNYKFLTKLPNGLTILATHQATGRGRGSNNWISPLGCLQFSILLRLPLKQSSNVVFVQYLAGLSIIQSIKFGLGKKYKSIGEKIRIKWPNDIYAVVEEEDKEIKDQDEVKGKGKEERKGTLKTGKETYAKLSGVLVNSSFSSNEFSLVVGCGINCLNERPTTSLSDLIKTHNQKIKIGKNQEEEELEIISQERLAGSVLATFEHFWKIFLEFGFEPFVEMYRETWLHSDQIVTLEDSKPSTKVRIVGIATDHGTLRAVPISSVINSKSQGSWGKARKNDSNGIESDEFIDLQPDGNSFDMLKNLIRSKK